MSAKSSLWHLELNIEYNLFHEGKLPKRNSKTAMTVKWRELHNHTATLFGTKSHHGFHLRIWTHRATMYIDAHWFALIYIPIVSFVMLHPHQTMIQMKRSVYGSCKSQVAQKSSKLPWYNYRYHRCLNIYCTFNDFWI